MLKYLMYVVIVIICMRPQTSDHTGAADSEQYVKYFNVRRNSSYLYARMHFPPSYEQYVKILDVPSDSDYLYACIHFSP